MLTSHKSGFGTSSVIFYTLFTFAAMAWAGTYSGGSGTAEDPYNISTVADWRELNATLADYDKNFILLNDIDFQWEYLQSVGSFDNRFTGDFNGGDYILSNGIVNRPQDDFVGLFGFLGSGGRIRNLHIFNITVTGSDNVGGLCGENFYGMIDHCTVTGRIITDHASRYLGILCGTNGGVISGCYARGTIDSPSRYIGSLCGVNYAGTIRDSHAEGYIRGLLFLGGLCGANHYGTIDGCFASGAVTGIEGSLDLGGLCGKNTQGKIQNCYAVAAVSGGDDVYNLGGLVGENLESTISNCYSAGSVRGGRALGGLCGNNDESSGIIIRCFWDRQVSGLTGSDGGVGLTTVQMKTLSIFRDAGWGDGKWVMADGLDYPRLAWENTGAPPIPEPVPIPFAGGGIPTDPYRIRSAKEFASLSSYPSILDKHFRLMDDLDMAGLTLYPVGSSGEPFSGLIDGNGRAIRNVVINLPGMNHVGLFGRLGPGGRIRNLRVENVVVYGFSSVAGLCGTFEGEEISDCHVTGVIGGQNDSQNIGGLCGFMNSKNGAILRSDAVCAVAAGIKAWSIGGLCGRNDSGTMTDCRAAGTVSGGVGSRSLGGLCGSDNNGMIRHCIAETQVTAEADSGYIGGLCGYSSGQISTCYAKGFVKGGGTLGGLCGAIHWGGTINDCFASGIIVGNDDASELGGLCGNCGNATISDSYATGIVSGGHHSNSIGGLCGDNSYSGTIRACYATAAVVAGTASYHLGGLCGSNQGQIKDCFTSGAVAGGNESYHLGGLCGTNLGQINACYAAGSFSSGTDSYLFGGLCGYNDAAIVSCFWDMETSSQMDGVGSQDPDPSGLMGRTTAGMKIISTFADAGWDFVGESANEMVDVWRMCGDGVSYPRLSWEFSGDGDMDCPDGVAMEDLVYLAGRWMATMPETAGAADADGNGKVDLGDFEILASNWMRE